MLRCIGLPLTITDFASRYLLCCDALEGTKEKYAFSVFERTFKDFGLPGAIRTDNGFPFASPNAFFGLSRLSVWWLERIARCQVCSIALLKCSSRPRRRTQCGPQHASLSRQNPPFATITLSVDFPGQPPISG
jgi:hypothetical protein